MKQDCPVDDEKKEEACLDEMSELGCTTTFYGKDERSGETIKDKQPYALVENRGEESRDEGER